MFNVRSQLLRLRINCLLSMRWHEREKKKEFSRDFVFLVCRIFTAQARFDALPYVCTNLQVHFMIPEEYGSTNRYDTSTVPKMNVNTVLYSVLVPVDCASHARSSWNTINYSTVQYCTSMTLSANTNLVDTKYRVIIR
jgi:hypothetical protein